MVFYAIGTKHLLASHVSRIFQQKLWKWLAYEMVSILLTFGTKHSRMDQVKFVKDSL